ncbi:MAG: sarcosine oxidase subunit delta [Chloroflexota bacterium]
MSLQIPCPHCGPRAVREFVYGEVPTVPDSITDADERDIDRGFMLTNPEGIQTEAWFHSYGCRRWVYIRRDTRTDSIVTD